LQEYATFKDEPKPQNGMSYNSMTESGGWVQDFTYLKFQGSWHYLAVILDLKTRAVVGWG
jgi:transposase InsO family protein